MTFEEYKDKRDEYNEEIEELVGAALQEWRSLVDTSRLLEEARGMSEEVQELDEKFISEVEAGGI